MTKDKQELDKAQKLAKAAEFKKKHSKEIDVVDSILQDFSNKETDLIDSLLEDFAPTKTKRKAGISVKSIFKLIGFAFRNPRKLGSIITIVRKPEILQHELFQQELLKRDSTWNFVKTVGKRLPKIGKALANFGIKEFKKDGILDEKSLQTLAPMLTEKESLQELRVVTNNFKNPDFDQNKNINKIVNLMLTSRAFTEYMSNKKTSLKEYMVQTIKSTLESQNLKAQKDYYDSLQKNGVKELKSNHITEAKTKIGDLQKQFNNYDIKINDLEKLADIAPILMNQPKQLKQFYASYEKGDFVTLGKLLVDLSKNEPKIEQYLKNNEDIFKKIIQKVIKTTPILSQYGVKDPEMLELFTPMLTNSNAEQVKTMIEQYQKQQWPELAIELCQLVENDKEFKEQLNKNRKNLGKIVEKTIDNIPMIKQYTGEMSIKDLTSNLLKDPKGLKELIQSYQKGGKNLAWGGMKFVTKKSLDSEFRGAVIQAAKTWFVGKGNHKQQIIEYMGKIKREESDFSKLDEMAKIVIESLPNKNEKDIKEAKKLQKLVKNKQLFSGVKINLPMNNMEINTSFVNSNFNNVSFKGSKLTNCSFENTRFNNVDFNGATIDGTTLLSLKDNLKKNKMLLNGVKIIGDLTPGTDLSDIDLSKTDLSEVTSFKDVNIKNANLSSAILPKNIHIFEGAYNLKQAKMPEQYFSKEFLTKNKDIVINNMIDKIIQKAESTLDPIKDKTLFRQEIIRIYNDDSNIGKKLRNELSNDTQIIASGNFPKENAKDFSDLLKADIAITLLYKNKNNPKTIETKLSANIIADKVTEKLFKKGANRGNDALLIRDIITKSLEQFIKTKSNIKVNDILQNPKFEKVVENITEQLKSNTVATWWGMMAQTGGIQISKKVKTNELVNNITMSLEENLLDKTIQKIGAKTIEKDIDQTINLEVKELKQIELLKEKIAKNLFGDNYRNTRIDSAEIIDESLKDAFNSIKKQHNNLNIANIVAMHAEELIGTVKAGYLATTRTGLTDLYYNNSSYTTAGLATGGIYLNKQKINDKEFAIKIQNHIVNEIGADIKKKLLSQNVTINPSHIAKKQSLNKKTIAPQKRNSEHREK